MTEHGTGEEGLLSPGGEHRWFLSQLLPRWLGVLAEEEERRFAAHEIACAECWEIWVEFQQLGAQSLTTVPHLPRSVLARWPELSSALEETARTAAREHLRACPECRAALEALGLESGLELETAPATPKSRSAKAGSAPSSRRRRRRSARRWLRDRLERWSNRDLILGTWSLAATAACVLLVLRQPGSPAGGDSDQLILPWVTAQRLRGTGTLREPGATSPNAIVLPRPARRVILRVPVPTELSESPAGWVEVQAPDGRRLLRSRITGGELARGSVMVLVSDSRPLQAGRYVVTLSGEPRRELRDETSFELIGGGER